MCVEPSSRRTDWMRVLEAFRCFFYFPFLFLFLSSREVLSPGTREINKLELYTLSYSATGSRGNNSGRNVSLLRRIIHKIGPQNEQ